MPNTAKIAELDRPVEDEEITPQMVEAFKDMLISNRLVLENLGLLVSDQEVFPSRKERRIRHALLDQLAEQPPCKRQVARSIRGIGHHRKDG